MWLLMHINEHTSGWESAFVCLDRPLSYRIIVPSRAACEHLNVCGVELTVSKVVPELVCNWDVPQLVLHFSGSSASGKNADLSAEFVVSSKILYFSFVVFCFKQADYSCVYLLVLAAWSGHDQMGAKQSISTKCQCLIVITSLHSEEAGVNSVPGLVEQAVCIGCFTSRIWAFLEPP